MDRDEKRMLSSMSQSLQLIAKALGAVNTNLADMGRILKQLQPAQEPTSETLMTPREWMALEGINFGMVPEDEFRLISREQFFGMMREVLRNGPPTVQDSNQLPIPGVVDESGKRWEDREDTP